MLKRFAHQTFLMLCLLAVAVVCVQAQGPATKLLPLERFTERLSKDVPVGGSILVGAVVLHDRAGNARRSLFPRLLWRGAAVEPTTESLCVTFASRDGQYYGEGQVSAATLGAHELSMVRSGARP